MRERSSRVFTRLSPGSSPFFLPRWRRVEGKLTIAADASAFRDTSPTLPTDDPIGSTYGATICSDRLEAREEACVAKAVAHLERVIKMAEIGKARRLKARSKMRS